MTCQAYGWKYLAPFSWNDAAQSLRFAAYVDGLPVDVVATQSADRICVDLDVQGTLTESFKTKTQKLVTRALCLDVDTSELLNISRKVGADYPELIESGAGRLLKSPTLWEDAAKTLFTTNCTWALTTQMCSAICSETFSSPTPAGMFPFPGPETIARFPAERIRELMPIGYRAPYLTELAHLFVDDPTLQGIESKALDYKAADKLVRAIKGFGNYATAHLLILSGYYDEVPVDTVVTAYLKEKHRVRKPHAFINRTYKKWGKYKWWGLKLESLMHNRP